MSKHKRTKLWIDPKFQTRVMMRVIMLELIVIACTGLLPLLITLIMLQASQSLQMDWGQIMLVFVVVSGIMAAGMTFATVRISHKIAGPIYKIQKTLESVARGEAVQPIKLRKGDEFEDLAAAVNKSLGVGQESPADDQSHSEAA